jgi:hypothetical protein
MFVLLKRRLVTSEHHHNKEAVAHSLPRGDSVLTTDHVSIHNLLHSPAMFAFRCRDQLLAKSDFDFRPCCWLGSPYTYTWYLTKGQRYPVHWDLLLPPRGGGGKFMRLSYVTNTTKLSTQPACAQQGASQCASGPTSPRLAPGALVSAPRSISDFQTKKGAKAPNKPW